MLFLISLKVTIIKVLSLEYTSSIGNIHYNCVGCKTEEEKQSLLKEDLIFLLKKLEKFFSKS